LNILSSSSDPVLASKSIYNDSEHGLFELIEKDFVYFGENKFLLQQKTKDYIKNYEKDTYLRFCRTERLQRVISYLT